MDNMKPREMFPNKPKYAPAEWYRDNVPGYREKCREWNKKSAIRAYEKNPEEFNAKKNVYKKTKYNSDPEYAEKVRVKQREYYQRKKAEKDAKQIQELVEKLMNNTSI